MILTWRMNNKVMKKIIEIMAGRNIKLSDYGITNLKKINLLWTVYDENQMWDHYTYHPTTGTKVNRDDIETLKPCHHHGAFLEERWHDWDANYDVGLLHYYSRLVEPGEKVKILIDYTTK